MLWIGLTGGLATGKSTVAKILREKGYPVIDADKIARDTLAPHTYGYHEAIKIFGERIKAKDGQIDRKKLAEIVFSDEVQLRQLEGLIHPLVQTEVQRLKKIHEDAGQDLVFYDVPLLFEKKITGFDKTIVVSAPEKLSLQRALKRDQAKETEVLLKMKNQIPMKDKVLKADFVIDNSLDEAHLAQEVEKVLEILLKKKNVDSP